MAASSYRFSTVFSGRVSRFWASLFNTSSGHDHDGVNSKPVVVAGASLANGKIWAGNGSGVAAAVTPSGDVTMSNAGVTAIGATKVTTAMLAAAAVTKAKMAIYISAERTATGNEETIEHGLGATPSAVFCVPTDTSPATAGGFTVTEGSHTDTNVLVTVTASKKYKVIALA